MALPAVAGPPLSRLQTQPGGHTGQKRPEPPLQIFTLQYSRAPPLPPNAKLISLNQDWGEKVDGREGHVVNFSEGIPKRVITGKTKIQ
jgi:hypothetical protein